MRGNSQFDVSGEFSVSVLPGLRTPCQGTYGAFCVTVFLGHFVLQFFWGSWCINVSGAVGVTMFLGQFV